MTLRLSYRTKVLPKLYNPIYTQLFNPGLEANISVCEDDMDMDKEIERVFWVVGTILWSYIVIFVWGCA